MCRIFIAENIPSLNKGEMAIMEGILESFKIIGDVEVTMLSPYPEIDAARYGSKIKIIDTKGFMPFENSTRNLCLKILSSILVLFEHLVFMIAYRLIGLKALRFTRSEIWKQYIKSDAIIQGHDGSFDIGGPILFYQFCLPFFAKALGKPIILYAGKIKPHKFFYRVTKSVLERFSLITLREEKSYQNLRKIKFQSNKVFVTADLAFLLKSASRERIQEIMEQEGIDKYSGPFIGMTATRYMAVSALNASKGFSGPDLSYQRHTESLAYVVDDLIDKLDCVVIFIPHCIGFGQELDDRIVAMDIYRICRNKERVKVITNEYGPHELKGLIGYFDLMIGERIHSVISAMAMCVPSVVISLSTDQRLDIIRMIGQEDAICYLENLDTEALLSKIYDTWDRKEEVRNNLRSNLQIIQERAMNNGKLLSQVLNSL